MLHNIPLVIQELTTGFEKSLLSYGSSKCILLLYWGWNCCRLLKELHKVCEHTHTADVWPRSQSWDVIHVYWCGLHKGLHNLTKYPHVRQTHFSSIRALWFCPNNPEQGEEHVSHVSLLFFFFLLYKMKKDPLQGKEEYIWEDSSYHWDDFRYYSSAKDMLNLYEWAVKKLYACLFILVTCLPLPLAISPCFCLGKKKHLHFSHEAACFTPPFPESHCTLSLSL